MLLLGRSADAALCWAGFSGPALAADPSLGADMTGATCWPRMPAGRERRLARRRTGPRTAQRVLRQALSAVLLLLLLVPAEADPPLPGFDAALTAQVYTTALAFMAPRTLDPVPVSQLTQWGLGGLTALDPDLDTRLDHGVLRLMQNNHELLRLMPPPGENPAAWANLAALFARTAWDHSSAVRHAGTQGIIQSFFDEMFNHLDPYSRYVPPREAKADRAERNGSAGLGVTLQTHGAQVRVDNAIAGGPGAVAGMRAGDTVISVDGQVARGQPAGVVAGWLAGPADSRVSVVWADANGRVRRGVLQRAMVPPETVFAGRLGKLLVIRILGFDKSTAAHVASALEAGLHIAHPPDGIVLDLRGNRGGVLRQAVEVADAFLSHGVITATAGRDPQATNIWRAFSGGIATSQPLVLLVDGRTASAAEVLSAALADQGRAVVVGSETLGKGLVQTVTTLPDGGELFVTWSRLLAPRGWPLQGMGVLPQLCTSRGRAATEAAVAALEAGVQPMAEAIARARNARAPIPPAQIVAIRQACPAAIGQEIDMEVARTLIEDPAAYAAALLPPLPGPN